MCRYEVRVEACTALGCSSSDWSSVLTLEAPPAGQMAPLLDLQPDTHTGLQTSFLLTWSPPAQPNGRILQYEVHRRLDLTTDTETATVVCRNVSTSCKDTGLKPYTVYQYQVLSCVHLDVCVYFHVLDYFHFLNCRWLLHNRITSGTLIFHFYSASNRQIETEIFIDFYPLHSSRENNLNVSL